MAKKPTPIQIWYAIERKSADLNIAFMDAFMDALKDGLTAEELRKLIEKRPLVYGKFAHWIEKLP